MKILRSSREILGFNGLVMIFTGLSFFIFSKKITIMMFPNSISNPEALEVGLILRYFMGAGLITIGIILVLARRISIRSGAQRVLLGSGIGFFIIFATALYVSFNFSVNIPIIALILFPILGILSLFVATRKSQG